VKVEDIRNSGGCNILSLMQIQITEHCGQTRSAPLSIREVPGSNPGAA
jgi:hypothetical protein